MAASPKTVPTAASVDDFIAAVPEAPRRSDCQTLVKLMRKATGEKPVMWGAGIVGFGRYQSPTGEWPVIGFSPRKSELVLYIMPGFDGQQELMARLGKHKTGKACLYVKRLSDVDGAVLAQIIDGGVQGMAEKRLPAKAA